ncbi:hypothetical protein CR513_58801, partial [Mucuna pruriens]
VSWRSLNQNAGGDSCRADSVSAGSAQRHNLGCDNELLDIPSVSQREEVHLDMNDQREDMIYDIRQESFQQETMCDSLCSVAKKPLYIGCTNFTRLLAVLKKEKRSFHECLKGIKVSKGYSSNFRTLVSMQDLKLVSLKSYDCHMLMQQLLLVAIHDVLPKNVRKILIRLCLFFNAICSKVINLQKLNELENEASIIVCQLEIGEIRLCNLVFLLWMYLVKHYIKILKSYVKNSYRPRIFIVERLQKKLLNFALVTCRCRGKGTRGVTVKSMGQNLNDDTISEIIKWLAHDRNFDAICWSGYNINQFSFYTKAQDHKSTVKNIGMMIMVKSIHFSTSKDKNSIMESTCTLNLKCLSLNVNGVQTDELGFTLVNHDKVDYKGESLVIASHVK